MVASALYFLGGGEHGDYDFPIFVLGFPSVLATLDLPVPEAFEQSSTLLRMIWDPALLNFVVLWGPIAGLLWLCFRSASDNGRAVRGFWNQYTLIAAGLLYAVAIVFLSFALAGAGHGWTAAMYSAPFGMVLCPALGAAIGVRQTRVGRKLLVLVIFGALIADLVVYHQTDRIEGWGYVFGRCADSQPGWLFAWFLVWFFWQGFAINLLFQRESDSVPDQTLEQTAASQDVEPGTARRELGC